MLLILVRNISFELRCAVSKMDEQVVFQENKLIFTLVGQLWDTGYRQQFRPISISAGRHRRKRTHRICWNQRRNGLLPSDVILLRPRREREREKKKGPSFVQPRDSTSRHLSDVTLCGRAFLNEEYREPGQCRIQDVSNLLLQLAAGVFWMA